jgi:hypothetical protein
MPLINGVNYSWQDLQIQIVGLTVPIVGITKVNYKPKQKKENSYGLGTKPISRGYGNYEFDGSIELYLDEWKAIQAASPNNDPLQMSPFDIIIVMGDGVNTPLKKDVLQQVEFTDDDFKADQGATKLLITVSLIIANVIHYPTA